MKKPFVLLLAICVAPAICPQTAQTPAGAASAVAITLGQASVALTGPWKFHIGDDSQWAAPDFDDSQWETVDLTPRPEAAGSPSNLATPSATAGNVPGWAQRGHPGYWGYAWYRTRVQVTAPAGESIALAAPVQVNDAYQLYVNGERLGGTREFDRAGAWPAAWSSALPARFPLPVSAQGESEALVIAFRVWSGPSLIADHQSGGLRTAPLIGGVAAIESHAQLVDLQIIRENAWHIGEALLFLLLAVIAVGLNLSDRTDPVYRWLIVVSLLIATANSTEPLGWLHLQNSRTGAELQWIVVNPAISGAWGMVWWRWFRLRRPTWMPWLIAGLTLLYSTAMTLQIFLVYHSGPSGPIAVTSYLSLTSRVLFFGLLIVIVGWGIRKQGLEGWLTVPAVALMGFGQFQGELGRIPVAVYPLGVRVSLHQIADLVLIAVLGVLILRRLLQSLERQREMALDVNQAREVQRVLIPEDLPDVPGWRIESEYRPAREVGGDFFQIIPLAPGGAVLIVIGDVTGKGLQAGMLVALSVGTIRTAADENPDPVHVLQTLNRRLVGRGQATCLAMRLDPDGSVTLANAGHLPPCLNGKELGIEGAVPLGIVADTEFPVRRFQVDTGDRMTLMSDGIAEAQDEQGHLFGFERAQSLSGEPARVIAEAAQSYGQQDDISVLCILRAAPVAAAVR